MTKYNQAKHQKIIFAIVKKLRQGFTVRELMDSKKYDLDLIDRAYEAYQRRSIHCKSTQDPCICPCGARVLELNVFGECLACQLRRQMGERRK
jgi:hypothetical protein